MSAERLSYLKALHCVRLWAGEWRQPELGNHCGVNGLLLGGYIVSPTVYFPLYISKLAVVFFFHALVHLWTGNVWKNMSNMVMCSLNLWMAKRRLQLVHYIMSNSSVPFLWASTSIYKFRSTTGERGKKICILFALWHLGISVFPHLFLWSKLLKKHVFFSPFLFNLKCTVALHSEPPSYMYPCHVAFGKFITAIQVNSSGLRACGSQSINSCRTLVELNTPSPPVQSPKSFGVLCAIGCASWERKYCG